MSNTVTSNSGTILQPRLTIPWFNGLGLGLGVSALKGEPMGQAVDFDTREESSGRNEVFTSKILAYDNDASFQFEYTDVADAATINIPPPEDQFSAKARSICSTLSSNTTAEIMFVICQMEGRSHLERLEDPQLRPHPQTLPPDAFRGVYGDYIVTQVERRYTCRIIVACSANNVIKSDVSTEVAKIFAVGGKLPKKSNTFKLLNASVLLRGYPAETEELIGVSIEKAFMLVTKLRESGTPPGVRSSVNLQCYSDIFPSKHTGHVQATRTAFGDIHHMYRIYCRLQLKLCHPSLNEGSGCGLAIVKILSQFRDYRHTFAGNSTPGLKREEVLQGLTITERNTDKCIKFHEFLQFTQQMDKSFKQSSSTGSRYSFKCGHFSEEVECQGDLGPEIVVLGQPDPGEDVYRVAWTTPPTTRSKLGISRQPLKFSADDSDDSEKPSRSGGATFEKIILVRGATVKVIGWSLSCEWDPKTKPTIKIKQKDNCILGDGLEVGLDVRVSTTWRCEVFYVVVREWD